MNETHYPDNLSLNRQHSQDEENFYVLGFSMKPKNVICNSFAIQEPSNEEQKYKEIHAIRDEAILNVGSLRVLENATKREESSKRQSKRFKGFSPRIH